MGGFLIDNIIILEALPSLRNREIILTYNLSWALKLEHQTLLRKLLLERCLAGLHADLIHDTNSISLLKVDDVTNKIFRLAGRRLGWPFSTPSHTPDEVGQILDCQGRFSESRAPLATPDPSHRNCGRLCTGSAPHWWDLEGREATPRLSADLGRKGKCTTTPSAPGNGNITIMKVVHGFCWALGLRGKVEQKRN